MTTATCLVFQACATTVLSPMSISVKVWRPAEFTLEGIKKIAVVDFKGTPDLALSLRGAMMSALFEGKKFTVLEREEMQKLLEEQRLTGQIVDERSAQRVGKMLGVDALVIGEISGERTEEVIRTVKVGEGKGSKAATVETAAESAAEGESLPQELVRMLAGSMRVNLRVVHVGTGELMAAKTLSFGEIWAENLTSKGHPSQNFFPQENILYVNSLPSQPDALKDLSVLAGRSCAEIITPHLEEITLEYEQGFAPMDKGFTYLDHGLVKEAQESWEEVLKKHPDNSSVRYNLGVFYESQGDLIKARDQYLKAMEIRSDHKSMESVARIRQRIEDAEKLKAQQGPPPATPARP